MAGVQVLWQLSFLAKEMPGVFEGSEHGLRRNLYSLREAFKKHFGFFDRGISFVVLIGNEPWLVPEGNAVLDASRGRRPIVVKVLQGTISPVRNAENYPERIGPAIV